MHLPIFCSIWPGSSAPFCLCLLTCGPPFTFSFDPSGEKVRALLHQISYINVSNSLLLLTPQPHLDMWGIDVARVVLLVWHELDPILLVRNHVAEAVALCVFGQSCRGENTVRPLLGNLLVLSEDPLLFQLQLQGLTLERKEWERKRKRGGGCWSLNSREHIIQRFLFQFPRGFYPFTFHHTEETIQTRGIAL